MQEDETDVDAVTEAMLTASRLLVAISATSIAAVDDALTLPQFRLLVVLANAGPSKLAVLAEELGVNPSSATRTVDRLIAAGMVCRAPNPASRREVVLTLSASGSSAVAKVTERRRAEIAAIVSKMPQQDRSQMVRALWSFARAGGEPPTSSSPYDL